MAQLPPCGCSWLFISSCKQRHSNRGVLREKGFCHFTLFLCITKISPAALNSPGITGERLGWRMILSCSSEISCWAHRSPEIQTFEQCSFRWGAGFKLCASPAVIYYYFYFPALWGLLRIPLQTCCMGPVKNNKKMAIAQRVNICGLGLFVKAVFVALSFQPVFSPRTSTAPAAWAATLMWSRKGWRTLFIRSSSFG